MAAMSRAPTTVALPALAASSPVIRAMLVTIAAVPPKLILVGLKIFVRLDAGGEEQALAGRESSLGRAEDEDEGTLSVGMTVGNPVLCRARKTRALLTR